MLRKNGFTCNHHLLVCTGISFNFVVILFLIRESRRIVVSLLYSNYYHLTIQFNFILLYILSSNEDEIWETITHYNVMLVLLLLLLLWRNIIFPWEHSTNYYNLFLCIFSSAFSSFWLFCSYIFFTDFFFQFELFYRKHFIQIKLTKNAFYTLHTIYLIKFK